MDSPAQYCINVTSAQVQHAFCRSLSPLLHGQMDGPTVGGTPRAYHLNFIRRHNAPTTRARCTRPRRPEYFNTTSLPIKILQRSCGVIFYGDPLSEFWGGLIAYIPSKITNFSKLLEFFYVSLVNTMYLLMAGAVDFWTKHATRTRDSSSMLRGSESNVLPINSLSEN